MAINIFANTICSFYFPFSWVGFISCTLCWWEQISLKHRRLQFLREFFYYVSSIFCICSPIITIFVFDIHLSIVCHVGCENLLRYLPPSLIPFAVFAFLFFTWGSFHLHRADEKQLVPMAFKWWFGFFWFFHKRYPEPKRPVTLVLVLPLSRYWRLLRFTVEESDLAHSTIQVCFHRHWSSTHRRNIIVKLSLTCI